MNLYKISAEYKNCLDELQDVEGITPDIIEDSLITIKDSLNIKAINVAAYIKNLESEILAMKNYEAEMYERRKRFENRIKSLKGYLIDCLELCEINKIEGKEFTLSIKSNPPKVVADEEKLDEKWFRVETVKSINKEALRDALIKGGLISGAHLERGKSLIIK